MSDEFQVNLSPGETVGGFRVEEFVGSGAMAVVYRATQINLDRAVALKILPADFSRNRDYVDRFFNEARAAAAFSHRNIVRAYDAGIDESDICYFAMEFIRGETVLDRIEHHGVLPPLDTLQIALTIAEALDYGWKEHKLLHGDIKPANLMINEHGETKLADFGLAKVAEIENVSGSVMLTPLYAAPEVIKGYQPENDCRPDIYSFGATLYHMLSGSPPFPGDDSKEVMRLQVEAALNPLHKVNPAIARPVSNFVSHLLRKDPLKRPQSWEEVIEGLRDCIDQLDQKGTVATATASGLKAPAPVKSKKNAGQRRRTAHARSTRLRKKKNSSGTIIVLLLILLVALCSALGTMLYLRKTASAPGSDSASGNASPAHLPSANIPRNQKGIAWRQLHRELKGLPTPEERLAHLKTYLPKAKKDFEKVRLHRMIGREETIIARGRPDPTTLSPDPVKPPDAAGHADPEPPKLDPARQKELADAAADAYTHVVYSAASYDLSFTDPPKELLRTIRQWQETYPDTIEQWPNVEFLSTTLLPAYARLKTVLIEHQNLFADFQLPEREDRVRALHAGGADVTVILRGGVGKVERTLSWEDISTPVIVKAFIKRLLSTNDLSPEALQTALSCMTLEGAVSAVESVSRRLSPEEARHWVLLAGDIATARTEKEALVNLEHLETAVEERAFLTAYGLLKDIREKPSTVRIRYGRKLAEYDKTIAPYTPEFQLKDLVVRAEDQLGTNPHEAFSLAVSGLGKYGKLGTTDVTDCRALLQKAVSAIAGELEASGEITSFDAVFKPFMHTGKTSFGRHVAVLELFGKAEALPLPVVEIQKTFAALAWLEAGCWEKAAADFTKPAQADVERLPGTQQYLFTFADALIAARHTPMRGVLSHRLALLHALAMNTPPHKRHAVLAIRYALKTETFPGAAGFTWPNIIEEMDDDKPGIPSYAIALTALHLTNRNFPEAMKRLAEVKNFLRLPQLEENSQWRVLEAVQLTQWIEECLSRPGATLPEEDAPPGRRYKPLLRTATGRWLLHQLNTQKLLPESEKPAIVDALGKDTLLIVPLDAQRRFEMLMSQVADEIDNGTAKAATSAVDIFLRIPSPVLVEYYPRALVLKAGLLMLDQRWTSAREVLLLIKLCTAASEEEKKWSSYFDTPSRLRVSDINKSSAATLSQEAFWESWLHACFWAGTKNESLARREASALLSQAVCASKKELAASVAQFPIKSE